MNILLMLSSYFKRNKRSLLLFGLVAFLLFYNVYQIRELKEAKRKVAVAEHNLNVANDSLRTTIAKNGQIEYNKLSFIFQELSDLKKANKELYDEVIATKGKVNAIVKTDAVVLHDTTKLIVTPHILDSNITAHFVFDTTYSKGNFRKRAGYTKYDMKTSTATGELTKDETGISLITGIKNLDKGKPEIFVRSNYPGLTITDIEGAVLDKNLFKKRQPLVTVGATFGWTPVTYDFKTKKTEINLTKVGGTLGLQFNLFRK